MLTRLTFRGVWKAFTGRQDAQDWKEAFEQSKARVEHLEKQVYELEKAIVQYTQGLNSPGVLAISQATLSGPTIDFRDSVNGAAASTGTLTNAPSTGNPSIWLKVKIDGNVRYIPAWA